MQTGEKIPASELILHPDGSVYHLKIRPEHLASTVILVGDPQRVDMISGYFDDIEFRGQNREIRTHTGILKNKRMTVMSTGMGTDNIDIVVNELDALVNIDLEKKISKPQHTALHIFRLGTSGGIQPDLPMNAVILSEYGLGLDGLLGFYLQDEKVIDQDLTDAFIAHAKLPGKLPAPYAVKSSETLLDFFGNDFIKGITATAPGFYGPQGRQIRLPVAIPDLLDRMQEFEFRGRKILNFEMETSALYGLSRLLGHRALSLCIAIANRKRSEYNQDYHTAIKKLIERFLEKIIMLP